MQVHNEASAPSKARGLAFAQQDSVPLMNRNEQRQDLLIQGSYIKLLSYRAAISKQLGLDSSRGRQSHLKG